MKTLFDILRDNRGFVGDAGDDDDDDDKKKDDDLLDTGDDDDEGSKDDDVTIDLDEKDDDDDKTKTPDNKAFAAMRVENKELEFAIETVMAKISQELILE